MICELTVSTTAVTASSTRAVSAPPSALGWHAGSASCWPLAGRGWHSRASSWSSAAAAETARGMLWLLRLIYLLRRPARSPTLVRSSDTH